MPRLGYRIACHFGVHFSNSSICEADFFILFYIIPIWFALLCLLSCNCLLFGLKEGKASWFQLLGASIWLNCRWFYSLGLLWLSGFLNFWRNLVRRWEWSRGVCRNNEGRAIRCLDKQKRRGGLPTQTLQNPSKMVKEKEMLLHWIFKLVSRKKVGALLLSVILATLFVYASLFRKEGYYLCDCFPCIFNCLIVIICL